MVLKMMMMSVNRFPMMHPSHILLVLDCDLRWHVSSINLLCRCLCLCMSNLHYYEVGVRQMNEKLLCVFV